MVKKVLVIAGSDSSGGAYVSLYAHFCICRTLISNANTEVSKLTNGF